MKSTALFIACVAASMLGQASAACYGSSTFKTCTDQSGNTYNVQRIGNTTQVNGYNSATGSNWNQSSQRIGNSTFTTGTDSDGNSWNQNSQKLGDTTIQSGYDSNGRSYNGTVRKVGNSVNYSGTDSNGNYYNKTCNEYGCY